jgi:hypothetical protein
VGVVNPAGLTCCEAIEKYQDGNMSQKRAMNICGASSEIEFMKEVMFCDESGSYSYPSEEYDYYVY